MNNIVKIFTIPIIILLFTAERCGDSREKIREETIYKIRKEEIKRRFGSEAPDNVELVGYETAARQKLTDLSDYLNLLGDSSLPRPFREKAGEMILDLFCSDSNRVSVQFLNENSIRNIQVGALVKAVSDNQLNISPVEFDSVRINIPFQKRGEDFYEASFRFLQKFKPGKNSDSSGVQQQGIVDVRINMESKVFGSDSLSIWTVRLENMQSDQTHR